jgi:hypothetical protein
MYVQCSVPAPGQRVSLALPLTVTTGRDTRYVPSVYSQSLYSAVYNLSILLEYPLRRGQGCASLTKAWQAQVGTSAARIRTEKAYPPRLDWLSLLHSS